MMKKFYSSSLIWSATFLLVLSCLSIVSYAQSTNNASSIRVDIRVFLEGLLEEKIEPFTIPATRKTRKRVVVKESDNEQEDVGCKICVEPEMVRVPAGSFTMGSTSTEVGRFPDEGPQHTVTIGRAFEVSKYEVTMAQFKAFVDETNYDAGICWRDPRACDSTFRVKQTEDHPVVYVSWNDAKAYIDWLSKGTGKQYRLLTDAEWEYVARAGTTTEYHFGSTIDPNQANYSPSTGTPSTGTVVVGSYSANAWGLHNVHGNVWEWVEDCYHEDYSGAPTDGSAWSDDCDWQDEGRVLRGGSFKDYPWSLRSANRVWNYASNRNISIGFRIAQTLIPVEPEMVRVPAGSFTMGSTSTEVGRFSDEGPQHTVTIERAYEVSKYEVTVAQFKAFIDGTNYDAGICWRDPRACDSTFRVKQTEDHPVVYVSWNDAKAYIDWLSKGTGKQYRLLTEAEWEYVARAGTTTEYHFGSTIDPNQANYSPSTGTPSTGTVVVGSYSANAWGLHNVHGNVWEWVEDCYHEDYSGAPTDGSAWSDDCYWQDEGRVLRGGSFKDYPWFLRSANRVLNYASNRNINIGFRIARTPLTP